MFTGSIFDIAGDAISDFAQGVIDFIPGVGYSGGENGKGLELLGYDVFGSTTNAAGKQVPTLFGYEDGFDVLKAGAKGIGFATQAAEKRGAAAERGGLAGVSQLGTSGNFDARLSEYGAANYAGSAANVERYWQQVLSTFLSPEQTRVK